MYDFVQKYKKTLRKNQYFLSKSIFLKQSPHGAQKNTGDTPALSGGPYRMCCNKMSHFQPLKKLPKPCFFKKKQRILEFCDWTTTFYQTVTFKECESTIRSMLSSFYRMLLYALDLLDSFDFLAHLLEESAKYCQRPPSRRTGAALA